MVLGLCCHLFGLQLQAHDPGLSSLNVSLSTHFIEVVTAMSDGDFRCLPQATQVAWMNDSSNHVPANTGIDLKFNGISPPLLSRQTTRTANRDWELHARFSIPKTTQPPGTGSNVVQIFAHLLAELPSGHRQVVTVVSETGQTVSQRILKQGDARIDFVWPQASFEAPSQRPVVEYIGLGVHHILTGYDHLLFLSVLLLVCRGIRDGLVMVTVFTLAHSITLAVSTLGILHFSSTWVEPVIAASIVYAALENLWHRELTRMRIVVVFVFGLVHGFGFASVLEDLHVGSGLSVIGPLLGFNIGVELGQLGVVAAVLPAVIVLQARADYSRRWMPAGSVLCAMVGTYWLVTRVLDV